MSSWITDIIAANRSGRAVAVPSICSAHEDVLGAAVLLAKELGRHLLVEATSNQVNQTGGYTGMTPADFVDYVHGICDRFGFDRAGVTFGGDHLGPQAWRKLDAETAMTHAGDMIRAYAEAGFTKIHLDCSEGCAGEPAALDDETVAARAAALAVVCERHAPAPDALCYVVGTEVPVPGGTRSGAEEHRVVPTDPDAARTTLAVHKHAFAASGADAAWARVVGLVVQPGLEFGPIDIDHFDLRQPDRLSAALDGHPGICFEAHSTDYQKPEVFPALARRHFGVLKVGPALTFAARKAIYALDYIRGALETSETGFRIQGTMESLMLTDRSPWQSHYDSAADDLRALRHFSWADRIRYYWNHPRARAEVKTLIDDLADRRLPAPLLDQHFSSSVVARAETLAAHGIVLPRALIHAQIQGALLPYFF